MRRPAGGSTGSIGVAGWLFIGGSGTISAHAVRAACEAGHHVRVMSRTLSPALPAAVEHLPGDRNNAARLAEVIETVEPDVLVDFVCFRPEQARAVIGAASGRVGHFVFVSTCDVLGYPLRKVPAPDGGPTTAGRGQYVIDKQACEVLFRTAAEASSFPLTVVRPGYSLGPRFVISLFRPRAAAAMRRIRDGRPLVLPGDGRTLIHPSDAADTGRMIAALGGEPVAYGKAYVAGTPGSVMTHEQYLRILGNAVGRAPELVAVPKEFLLATRYPLLHDGLFGRLTRFDVGFQLDGFRRDFPDFRWRGDIAGGIAAYWERVRAAADDAKDAEDGFEDEVITAWRGAIATARRLGERA